MKAFIVLIAMAIMPLRVCADQAAARYPILAVARGANSDVLLRHEFTAQESALFKEMNEATINLPSDAAADTYRTVAIRVGKRHGLSAAESVAFYVRTFYFEFEPRE